MKTEKIEQMRINSRRNGINPKSWYHAGAEDMQEAMIGKACKVFDRLMMDYEQDRKSHDECLAEMRKAMMED